jgi:hypothetical protein
VGIGENGGSFAITIHFTNVTAAAVNAPQALGLNPGDLKEPGTPYHSRTVAIDQVVASAQSSAVSYDLTVSETHTCVRVTA